MLFMNNIFISVGPVPSTWVPLASSDMYHTPTTVSQYNEAGWEKDLPTLQTGRENHGCAYFNNDAGSKVCSINIDYYPLITFQTMLVTGGHTGSYLSSTELLVGTASAWVFTGELPSPRHGLRGATIDNMV